MSYDTPQIRQQLRGPRALLAGKWRRRMERLTVALFLSPAIVAFALVVYVALVVATIAGAFGVVVFTAAALYVPPVRTYAGYAWWRGRWYWDARAAGLAVEAEPNVLARTDGPLDRTVVVVPTVSLRLLDNGARSYRVRPLPGQTLGDFEAAVPRLTMRWGVEHVALDAALGSKFVTITVHRGAPPASEYRRAA